MVTYVALYRGSTIENARMIALSCNPGLVVDVARRIENDPLHPMQDDAGDPVLSALNGGKRQALRLVTEQEGQE